MRDAARDEERWLFACATAMRPRTVLRVLGLSFKCLVLSADASNWRALDDIMADLFAEQTAAAARTPARRSDLVASLFLQPEVMIWITGANQRSRPTLAAFAQLLQACFDAQVDAGCVCMVLATDERFDALMGASAGGRATGVVMPVTRIL